MTTPLAAGWLASQVSREYLILYLWLYIINKGPVGSPGSAYTGSAYIRSNEGPLGSLGSTHTGSAYIRSNEGPVGSLGSAYTGSAYVRSIVHQEGPAEVV